MMILVKAINEEVAFLKKKEAVFIGALLVISVVLCIFDNCSAESTAQLL